MNKHCTFAALTVFTCLGGALTAQAQTAFRPPAVPLVTHDPYFSVWSNTDKLTDSATRHWTGREQALSSLLRVDGQNYRLMGATPAAVPALERTRVEVLPTQSIYTFAGAGVSVRLVFTSPLLPEDLDLLSRPVTYVTWQVTSTDGKTHDVSVYLDASSALAVNTPDQKVVWEREKTSGLTALKMGSEKQPVLQKDGDNLRIDWGYAYLAAPQKDGRFALGGNDTLEAAFTASGSLPTADDTTQPRAVNSDEPVAAVAFNLGKVADKPVSRHALLAYDDVFALQFMGQNLRPYWRRNGADAGKLLGQAEKDYASVLKRCDTFDAELVTDLTRIGGEKYARLASLAYRQSLAAQKIAADAKGQPLSFSKENFSNGCMATVDVIYPAAPQMIALSPSLLKASLQPIMQYGASERWKFPFAPHDLGRYPRANGQVYGDGENGENNQMPVEESGNLIILLAALSKVEGNTKFADQFWPTITKWADYLAEKGFDPENQLCTDDFAGHLAHNVNLSAKAIVALGGYAQMAELRRDTATAEKYRTLAHQFAAQWIAAPGETDHTRLAFDRPGTWAQKYNLAWDSILGLNLFPQSVYDREMAYYRTKLNIYGLPLDSRRDYTKLDWEIWTATLTGRRDDFEAIVNPIYDWINATPSRVPLTDWYNTNTGKMQGFQARSVVGGVFIPMLKDAALWRKWTARDKNRPDNWADIPPRPIVTEVLLTGQTQEGPEWRYTLEEPAADWFAPGFKDSDWKVGAAGFGTANTPGIQIRTPWNTRDIWMRRPFLFDGSPKTQFVLNGYHDDAATVYLNGTAIAELDGYTVKYQPLADLPPGILKQGMNVLAVHCHQDAGGQGVDMGLAQLTLPKK